MFGVLAFGAVALVGSCVSVEALRGFLRVLPVGPVEDVGLVDVLAAAWDSLDRDDRSMEAFKLDRLEAPRWDGLVLTFSVERHGGTVLGSTRAEVQHWEIDSGAATARLTGMKKSTVRRTSGADAQVPNVMSSPRAVP